MLWMALGATWRQVKFWTLASSVACFVACLGVDDASAWSWMCTAARSGLILASLIVMLWEWFALDRYLRVIEVHLRDAGRPLPARFESLVYLQLLPMVVTVAIIVQVRFWMKRGELLTSWFLPTLVWTAAGVLVLTLILGGFSAIRTRRAARSLGERPWPSAPMPWFVGIFCGVALAVAFVGLPSPAVMGEAAYVVMFVAIVIALAVAMAGDVFDQAVLEEQPATGRDTELLLELGPDDNIVEVLFPLAEHGADFGRAFPKLSRADDADLGSTWVVRVPTAKAQSLVQTLASDVNNVDRIELNALLTVEPSSAPTPCGKGWGHAPVNDPLAPGQWGLASIGGLTVLESLKGARPQRRMMIAVIDTGINGAHEDLREVTEPRGRSDDRRGHGTAVAGSAAAVSDNGLGIASLNHGGAWLTLRSYGALAGPRPAADDVARAVLDAKEDGADVILMAFGAEGQAPHSVQRAIQRAVDEGVLLVAAAGNRGSGQFVTQWPANLPGVLSVGAATQSGALARFSSHTRGLAVAAPGVGICAPSLDGSYALQDGTSMAAGVVAGLGGVLRGLCPALSGEEVAQLLVDTAVPSRDLFDSGPKMVRLEHAVRALAFDRRCR